MSFVDALRLKEQYGPNAILPPDMRAYTPEELSLKAEEEQRPFLEAQARKAAAERVELAATAVQRAMAPKPRRHGWRVRVSFLNNFERAHSVAEAAARTGIDETTARRWRRKFPAFDRGWIRIVESRGRCKTEDLVLRAGEPQVVRRYFFRGKQVGELTRHEDRALMFLIQRADTAQRREEDRAERREIRVHELEMLKLEIAARAPAPEPPPAPESAPPAPEPAAEPAPIEKAEKESVATPGFSGHETSTEKS